MGRSPVKIYCYDQQGNYLVVFNSLADAGRQFKAQTANLSICIKLGIKCRGFYFSTVKLPYYPAHSYRRGGQPLEVKKEGTRKWIKCSTYSEASELTGISHTAIRNAIKKGKFTSGFYFRLLPKEEFPKRNQHFPALSIHKKQVVALTKDGKTHTFRSICEAAKKLNINEKSIRNVLAGRWNRAGGYSVSR